MAARLGKVSSPFAYPRSLNLQELKGFQQAPLDWATVAIEGDNLYKWNIILQGPVRLPSSILHPTLIMLNSTGQLSIRKRIFQNYLGNPC